jgi:hypothetical protein
MRISSHVVANIRQIINKLAPVFCLCQSCKRFPILTLTALCNGLLGRDKINDSAFDG